MLQHVFTAIGVLASLVTVIGGVHRAWTVGGRGIWERAKLRVARTYWRVPKRTLIVIPRFRDRLGWGQGGIGAQPAMQVVGDFFLTNISETPVLVTETFLLIYRWFRRATRASGHLFVRDVNSDIYGAYAIPGGHTTDGRADWWISPPIRKPGQRFRARAGFVDQYGNEHLTDVLTFESR